MWIPDENGTKPDLLATSGEYLRIFMIDSSNNTSTLKSELKNIKQAEYSAPLTSFDWNVEDPNILGTCSIDTTCTIWDLEKECVKTQLIAHDKEVYDMAFAQGLHTFASAGADGSIRHFDTRNLEHSTIIFESPDQTPFLRVVWNRADPHYIATIMMDSPKVTIVDIRYPMLPFMELQGHSDCVNSISWAPTSSIHICTAGDDSQTLIWDLLGPQDRAPTDALEPMLAYKSEAEVTMIQWPTPNPAWISIAFNNKMQMLKVQHAYSLNDVIF